MISRDAPAQVIDGGRRRDGGSSFIISRRALFRPARGGEDEGRVIRTSPWHIAGGLDPQASRRRPRYVGSVASTLSIHDLQTASRGKSAAPFRLT